MMIQRFVVVLLVMVVVFVGCGEDEPEKVKPKEVDEVDKGPSESIIWEKDGAKMVLIPAGALPEVGDWFWRPHSFYMDVTEVTVGQFKRFLGSSDYKPEPPIRWPQLYELSPTSKHPMIFVNWHDATAYCEWAGKRLPTEKEWEFAARGGLVDKGFPWGDGENVWGDDENVWGDDENVAREYANYEGTGGKDKWEWATAPAGSFKPNGYGLYDMAGNVWEWCQDRTIHRERVCLGGSFGSYLGHLAFGAFSLDLSTTEKGDDLGFRCIADVEE